jgi:hypothetical protein
MLLVSNPIRLWRAVALIEPRGALSAWGLVTEMGFSSQFTSPELRNVFTRIVPDSLTGIRDVDSTLT